jgi:DNA end-binding protein Ku
MPRALWKGAITFGLVHIPVALYPAARSQSLNFDWLEKKSLKPVGYKRVVKETGKEVAKEDIVRGLEYEPDHYVVLSDEEIKGANAKATQTVEILDFVAADDIPPYFYNSPYVLAPVGRGEKVYMLLREALRKSGRAGIAQVVIQTKQHLAALLPFGPALLLNTLRWPQEIRSFDEIELPPESGKKGGFSAKEFAMAEQLIDEMSEDWDPARYQDTFYEDVMAMVDRKVKQGKIERVETPERAADAGGADIIDLTELLKRSLRGKEPERRAAAAEGPRPSRAAKAVTRPKAAAKASTRAAAKGGGSKGGGKTASRKVA